MGFQRRDRIVGHRGQNHPELGEPFRRHRVAARHRGHLPVLCCQAPHLDHVLVLVDHLDPFVRCSEWEYFQHLLRHLLRSLVDLDGCPLRRLNNIVVEW